MLQLYDINKNKIKALTKYEDLSIESVLSTGDKTLSFLYPSNLGTEITEEGYIRNKKDEFVIKEISDQGEWKSVKAQMNVEDLEGKAWEHFDQTEQTIKDCLTLVCAGTGWTVQVENVNKRRTVRNTNCSSWDLIQEAKKRYRVEIEFDSLNKIIKVYEKIGSYRGIYFSDELNLKALDIQSNSYDFYTRIKPIGKDNLKVNINGKDYLENYQYSSKVKTLIWKDERYTKPESLVEDGIAKLEELSKPYRSYKADIIDLANINEKYKNILDYKLGDTIILVSKEKKIKEKQRIVKIIEYPDDPGSNSCEIANTTISFEDLQKEFQDTSDTVKNITEDDGTISEGAIKVAVKNITVDKADIKDLNAAVATIGQLEVNKLNVDAANLKYAEIDKALIEKAKITDLTAKNIKVDILEGSTANLQTILTNFIAGESGQFLNLTVDNVVIDDLVVKDLIAKKITVADLVAGNIDTNRFNIVSENGGISIVGATQQFKDKSNKVRLQIGQDAQGNFNFILKGVDGTTTLIDHTGIKENAIANDLIKENMVAENAIGEKQINYSSMITGLNKDTNTQLIKASKVAIDLEGQKLDVAFNTLKTTVDNTKVGGRNILTDSEAPLFFDRSVYISTRTLIEEENERYINVVPSNNPNYSTTTLYRNFSTKKDECRLVEAVKNDDSYSFSLYLRPKIDCTMDILISDYNLEERPHIATKEFKANEWGRIEVENFIAKYSDGFDIMLNVVRNVIFDYKFLKIEKGTKATDWTPALEDTAKQIDSIENVNENILRETNTFRLKTNEIEGWQNTGDFNITFSKVDNCYIASKSAETNTTYKYYSLYSHLMESKKDDKFVFSSYIKIKDLNKLTIKAPFVIEEIDTNGAKVGGQDCYLTATNSNMPVIVNDEWAIFYVKYKVKLDTTVKVRLRLILFSNGEIAFKRPKVERGIKYTPWVSSKEDILESTQTLQTKLNIEQGKISTLIKDTTIEKSGTAVKLKDDYSTFKQTQDNFNISVSNKQSEFATALSIREQTKLNGIELFDQKYTSDLTAKPFTNLQNNYEIVPATNVIGDMDYMPNVIKHKDSGINTLFFTEFIPVTNFDNPFYGSLDVLYPENIEGGVYLQVAFFDKDFNPMSTNDAAMNLVGNRAVTAINTWQNFNGFVEIPQGDFRRKSAYIRFRVAVRYSRKQKDAYIRNISVKQLGGANLAGLNTTVTTTENKVADIELKQGGIKSRVESLEISEVKNRKVGAFRYVRDYLKGNSINTGNHWIELQVWTNGTNIAQGKTVTSNSTITNPTLITDGIIASNPYSSSPSSDVWAYAQIDLGEIKNDVDYIKVWHYYSDSRAYNNRLEVSQDGVVWQEIFNSDISGTYKETVEGRIYIINESKIESRLQSAEQKITADAIVNTVKASQTDGKNTFAQTATVELLVDQVKFDFKSSGGYNYFKRSIQGSKLSSAYIELTRNYSDAYDDRCKAHRFQFNNGASWRFHGVIPSNGTYSLSFYAKLHSSSPSTIQIKPNICDKGHSIINQVVTTEWKYFKFENFIINNYTADVYNFLDFVFTGESGTGTGYTLYMSHICINEGPTALAWTPNSNEIQDGNTVIDATGVTISNGALTVKNKANIEVIKADANGDLIQRGRFEQYASNGKKSVEIANNSINFYDWELNGDFVGEIYGGRLPETNHGYFCIYGDTGNPVYLGIGTKTCITLNDNGQWQDPITFHEEIGVNSSSINFRNKNSYIIGEIFSTSGQDFFIGANYDISASTCTAIGGYVGGSRTRTVEVKRTGLHVLGSISCSGAKTRAVKTRYGTTTMNAYETAGCLFGDVGEGLIGEDGLCYIYIDPVLLETINTKCSYQVFLQTYGEDQVYPKDRLETYFIVKGIPGTKFAWELKAKQRDYEADRLEMLENEDLESEYKESIDIPEESFNYEEAGFSYIEDYEKELLMYGQYY